MTNYRCRDHTDYEVTWRGTGCPVCVREGRQAQQRRNLQAKHRRGYREGFDALLIEHARRTS